MDVKWFVAPAIVGVCCLCLVGCNRDRHSIGISQVTYSSNAGPILPELQWYEEIVITKESVSLTRNGRTPDTEVNEGTWKLAVDAQAVAALFAQLEAVDRAAIQRVEPDSSLDGGHTESYTLAYAGGKTFSLVYDPGVTYTSGELIVEPITAFFQNLSLLDEAIVRYK